MNPIIGEKIREFFSEDIPRVFERDLSLGNVQQPAKGNLVNAVVGVRRCGKTYRLYQEMQRILDEGYPKESLLYFNFEDERLKPYDPSLLSEVVETFFTLSPRAKEEGAFFFFDEIQEVPDWGLFLRRMVDTQKATIYVTGSSSKMLSMEVASEFRGRALPRVLFPLSFSEFARFHGVDVPQAVLSAGAFTERERTRLRSLCADYLLRGGFISVQDRELSEAALLLQEYAYRTVSYDVIERYNLTNLSVASSFLAQCMASSGRELSVNKLHGRFRSQQVSVSRETLSQLLGYYEDAYLLFSVRDFSRALADNPRSPSKVYAVDPGMFMAFSPSAARDEGQRLETAVFLKLLRGTALVRQGSVSRLLLTRGSQTRAEVDFVVGDALLQTAYQLVQVSTSLEDPSTRKREVSALKAAMPSYGVAESWIVTIGEEELIELDEGRIHVVPAWKWLLDGERRSL